MDRTEFLTRGDSPFSGELAPGVELRLLASGPLGAQGLTTALAVAPPEAPTRRIRFGTKWLETDSLRLRDDEGLEQPLTRSEYDLLKAFADHPKRALTRERLLDLADARDPEAFDRAIDVRINRIRKKIEPDPANPRFIRTVRGLGYVFRPEGD